MTNCLLTPENAAERLGILPRRVLQLVRAGELGGAKVGKYVRIPSAALEEYVTAKTEEARASLASTSAARVENKGGSN